MMLMLAATTSTMTLGEQVGIKIDRDDDVGAECPAHGNGYRVHQPAINEKAVVVFDRRVDQICINRP